MTSTVKWDGRPEDLASFKRSHVRGRVDLPSVVPLGTARRAYIRIVLARIQGREEPPTPPFGFYLHLQGDYTASAYLLCLGHAETLELALVRINGEVGRALEMCNLFRCFNEGEYGYVEAA